jgi:hypothetical protein
MISVLPDLRKPKIKGSFFKKSMDLEELDTCPEKLYDDFVVVDDEGEEEI